MTTNPTHPIQAYVGGHSVELPDELLGHRLLQTIAPPVPGESRSQHQSLVVADGEDSRWSQNCSFPNGPPHPARGLQQVFEHMARADERLSVRCSPLAQLPRPLGSYTKTGLAEFVYANELGTIRHRENWYSRAQIVTELALRFSAERIVVLSDSIMDLRCLHRELQSLLASEVGLMADWPHEFPPRIALAQFSDWNNSATELSRASIVLLLNAANVMCLRAVQALSHSDHRFRLYGLLRFAEPMSRETADRVTAAFGFEEHWLADRLTQWRPSTLSSLPLPIKFDSKGLRRFEILKRYLWAKPRTDRIIRTARQIANGSDSNRLRAILTGLDMRTARIVLLAPQYKQAKHFADQLHWSLVTGTQLPGRSTVSKHCVLMPDAIEDYQFYPDVVINTGSEAPQFPAHWLVMSTRSLRPIRVVDFNDVACVEAKRWARQRKFAYEAMGFFETGTTPAAGRLRRFLNGRPKPRARRGDGAIR